MKVYIETLGCPKNVVDSENAAGLLEKHGHQIINSPEEADVIMVNTCGFINDAKQESIDTIISLAEYKQDNNDKLLVVSGCLGARYNNELFDEIPEADIIMGVNDYEKFPQLLNEAVKGKRQKINNSFSNKYLEIENRKVLSSQYTAFLKISEGCDNCCSYCVIPLIRGAYRSREFEEIVKEARSLAESGCKEITLVAQDVTSYGIDLYGGFRIHELVDELCKIEKIKWIRLMYCYSDKITDDLIDAIARNEKVCKYIDIPIQHCSNKILESMNRKSTKDSIVEVIEKLRSRIPDIHIRTSLITGLPGERQEEFNELKAFVTDIKFERLGVFQYSKEEGTPAASMKGQVREQVKIKRKEELMRLQQSISLHKNQQKIGKYLTVLVEEQDDEDTYIGRTQYDAREIDNSVIFTSKRKLNPGDFVTVKILDAFDYDITGEVSDEFTK